MDGIRQQGGLTELNVGLGVALAGTIADAFVKAEGSGHFRPHLRWTLFILLEPWYVLKGMMTLIEELPRALTSNRDGHFKAVQFDAGEEDVSRPRAGRLQPCCSPYRLTR